MGPLIPNGIIPFEWNNIIAIIIGIAFGFILEASGFSSSRKLAGIFYGYDFAVLKVFLTAALVSIIGLLYMDYLGYIAIDSLYIHPTYMWGAILGGTIMGVGFVSSGFCPGTGLCAVAIGKIDAIAYLIGILIGIFLFTEFYEVFKPIYEGYFYGNITLDETFGISPYLFTFLFTLIAIALFALSNSIRKRRKKIFY